MKGQKGLGSVPVSYFIVLLKSFDRSTKLNSPKKLHSMRWLSRSECMHACCQAWLLELYSWICGGRREGSEGSEGCLLTSTYALRCVCCHTHRRLHVSLSHTRAHTLIPVCRIFHLTGVEYIFFAEVHRTFSKINHNIGCKTSLNT